MERRPDPRPLPSPTPRLARAWTPAPWEEFLRGLVGSARQRLPRPLKAPLRWLSGRLPSLWRESPTVRRTLRFIRQSEGWDEARIRAHQLARLREIVNHAGTHVPGYRQKFLDHGVDPTAIRSLEDLPSLPCLTKDDLRASPERYVADNTPKDRLQVVFSGGTTGSPTGFYHIAQYNDDVARAFRLAMWSRVGYTPTARALDLTAAFAPDPLRFAANAKTLWVSISALDPTQFPSVADAIGRFDPEFVIGFPSTVTLFAQLLRERPLPELRMRGVITASEVMHEAQRRYITEVFRCRILEWYGLAEYAGFAAGCESSDAYHFFPQAGTLELLDEQDRPVTREGDEGEIVLTGFYNWATPFIRYRTGDRGVLGRRHCDACGRHYPLVERISGRTQEFLVARTGRLLPGSALNVHSDLFHHVWTYQWRQDTPGEVDLSLVRKPSYGPAQTDVIRREMQAKLGPDMTLRIHFVEAIPRTPRGKHQFIVQTLPRPESGCHPSVEGDHASSGAREAKGTRP